MRLVKLAWLAAVLTLAASPIVAANARVHSRHSHHAGTAHSTVGMSHRSGPSQDSPNGSPGAPPTAKQGPAGGDASQHNDAPK
jgi:hypothetical protein